MTIIQLGERHLSLWLHGAEDAIPADEWREALARVEIHLKHHGVRPSELLNLVVSDGAAPNAKQRAEMEKLLWQQGRGSMAVITSVLSNPIKRGVATALTWINPKIRFFQPAQFREAIVYLELTPERSAILAAFRELQATLPPIAALSVIASTSDR